MKTRSFLLTAALFAAVPALAQQFFLTETYTFNVGSAAGDMIA